MNQTITEELTVTPSCTKFNNNNNNRSPVSTASSTNTAQYYQNQNKQQQHQLSTTSSSTTESSTSTNNKHNQKQMLTTSSSPVDAEASGGDCDINDDNEDDRNSSYDDVANSSNTNNKSAHHHVGPVMGIFFKVWSFVKVTKSGRDNHHHHHHHQSHKMRRQNSADEMGQFHYISGTELSANCSGSGSNSNHTDGPNILQDRHFRRAGSHPVGGVGCNTPDSSQVRANRLQVIGGLSRTGTNSTTTSSGASSAGSQIGFNQHSHPLQLASNGDNNNKPPGNSSSQKPASSSQSSGVRRHLSAYSLRRSTAEVALVQQQNQQLKQQQQQQRHSSVRGSISSSQQQQQQLPSKQSWASKIKRSATTVNQTDFSSYVSRYRFRREPSTQIPVAPIASPRNQQQHVVAVDRPASLLLFSNAGSHDARAAPETKADGDAVGCEDSARLVSGDDEEDAESNDIYSTPHDSIQSVPSGQQMVQWLPTPLLQAENKQQLRMSSSTGNFGAQLQYLQQQQQQESNKSNQKYKPTNDVQKSNHSPPAPTIKQLGQQAKQDSAGSCGTRLANSSHFFISSSSSDDSNCCALPPHHSGQAPSNSSTPLATQPPGSWFHLDQRQVTVQQGVHYHPLPPTAIRPNSLQMVEEDPTYAIPSQFTPTTGTQRDIHSSARLLPPVVPSGYRKSPSMHEFMTSAKSQVVARRLETAPLPHVATVTPPDKVQNNHSSLVEPDSTNQFPNSISLYDFSSAAANCRPALQTTMMIPQPPLPINSANQKKQLQQQQQNGDQMKLISDQSEYRLAKMLLAAGSGGKSSSPAQRDQDGYTALMLAVLSDNSAIVRCLLDHKADPNDTNSIGQSALDLLCSRAPIQERLDMLRLLIDSGANPDTKSRFDSMRLLDRLISQHSLPGSDDDNKLPYIDFLLQNGAKLGSTTWQESRGKQDVQMRLLKKLCQDGYFLYKISSIEQAVYRFEYALMRAAEFDKQQQLIATSKQVPRVRRSSILFLRPYQEQTYGQMATLLTEETRQIKYQAYLGLSRCERKRKFYKRALEFADLAILLESTSYEGYYSKAHILKDLGELDDALRAIEQTERLVEHSIERMELELRDLRQQAEEALVLDGRLATIFSNQSSNNATSGMSSRGATSIQWIEARQMEVSGTLEYLQGARCFVSKLRVEIMDDKQQQKNRDPSDNASMTPTANAIAT